MEKLFETLLSALERGEDFAQAARRGIAALTEALSRSEGELAAVCHSGLNRAMLCALTGRAMAEMRALPQPYLCVNVLLFDGNALAVSAFGLSAAELLFPKEESDHGKTV